METRLEADIRRFIVEYGVAKEPGFSRDASLQRLGLDGQDAMEFMEAFARRFNVDMTFFVFDKYFGAEAGFNPFAYLCRVFLKKSPLEPITLGDLVRAASNRKWD